MLSYHRCCCNKQRNKNGLLPKSIDIHYTGIEMVTSEYLNETNKQKIKFVMKNSPFKKAHTASIQSNLCRDENTF